MPGLARQAAMLSVSRITNYGLMIISPLILVRFLTVHDFGRYREFLLYASLVQTAAAFSINESLLYFIPRYPASVWRVVRENTYLTGFVSLLVVGVVIVAHLLIPTGLVGPYLVPVSLYVLLFVNLDWWESFWIAMHRSFPVFVYSSLRLLARMCVVVSVAIVSKSVWAIIWSLILLEGLRFAGALVAWRSADRSYLEPPIENITREQLQFCVPFGIASLLYTLNRNLGNLVIVRFLGTVALAHFTIGTYADPIILVLRNSISTVLLPQLVRLREPAAALRFWHRATVMNCLLVFPCAVIAAWYAEPLVLTAFGAAYRPAAPVLQWYVLVLVLACFDFSPLLRAINQTRPFVTIGVLGGLVNGLVLVVLLPLTGIVGAAIGLVVASVVTTVSLGYRVSRLYGSGLHGILPWAAIVKVTLCAVGAAVVAFSITTAWRASLLGVTVGAMFYVAVFLVLVLVARVEEATAAFQRLKPLLATLFRR